MVALEPLASILGAARGRARAVMGVRGRTVAVQGRGRVVEAVRGRMVAVQGRGRVVEAVRGRTVAVQGRGRVVEAVQGRTVAVRGRDRAVEGVRGRMVAVQGQGRVRADRVRATAALLVPGQATMQEEEIEPEEPAQAGPVPVGPGQAQALVPPAIPELSG